jgi:hypothetical protein
MRHAARLIVLLLALVGGASATATDASASVSAVLHVRATAQIFSYDSPSAATTLTATMRVAAARGERRPASPPWSSTSSKRPTRAAKGADDGLDAARRARDAAGRHPDGRPNRDSPVYVGGQASDGRVMGTGNGPGPNALHAEDLIQRAMTGARMTEPYAWRRGLNGELEWQPFTVVPDARATTRAGCSSQVRAVHPEGRGVTSANDCRGVAERLIAAAGWRSFAS